MDKPWMTLFPALALGLALGAGACKKHDPHAGHGHGQAAVQKSYPLTGEVVRLQAEGRVVILKHDKIEGFMDAMTMGFELADPKQGQGLKPGDRVSATLVATADAYVLQDLKKR